jgi:hypothetical protein
MLKKLLTGSLAAGALAVPLAGVAWADPVPSPNPPTVPNTAPANPANPAAVPEANGQNPANPAAPGANGQAPTCVVSANIPAQGTPGTWRQVATLQGSTASDLGLPAGQNMKVFCAPMGTQNTAEQPASLSNPSQTSPGQPGAPAPAPLQTQPGQPGPQNPMPGTQ